MLNIRKPSCNASDGDAPTATTGMLRGAAAAILLITAGVACTRTRTPEPLPPDWTSEEIEQLVQVTDRTVDLMQSLSTGERSHAEIRAAVVPLVAALERAGAVIERHPVRVSIENPAESNVYRESLGCLSVSAEPFELLTRPPGYYDPVYETEITPAEQQHTAAMLSSESTHCAVAVTERFRVTEKPARLDELGPAIGAVYAVAAAYRAAGGLGLQGLLRDQIAANEIVVARLARECSGAKLPNGPGAKVAHRCVAYHLALDALPKLRSALSLPTKTESA